MRRVNFAAVWKIGLALPDVEMGTTYGTPALKLGGQLIACKAIHKSAEPNTLVVRIDFDDRDALIAEDPATYYLKDHYVDYACVLVRLSKVHPDAIRDLLIASHRFVSARKRVTRGSSRAKPAPGRSAASVRSPDTRSRSRKTRAR
jgi:hypothetical protein